jgi:thiosulfate/3-mercaptopyruvate sulfurtransferase
MKKWKLERRKMTNLKTKVTASNYYVKENKNMIKIKSEIDKNVKKEDFTILDARSKNRFLSLEPEPRPGVKSGSIKGSKSLPFNDLINIKNNTFLDKKKLKSLFNVKRITGNKIVMSCGSSVSAATLALAYSLINDDYMAKIYIGSWAEYGQK